MNLECGHETTKVIRERCACFWGFSNRSQVKAFKVGARQQALDIFWVEARETGKLLK
ncbi:MAG: hypothetical protein ACTHMY_08640 [Solirubrobacteraceae bacterium]